MKTGHAKPFMCTEVNYEHMHTHTRLPFTLPLLQLFKLQVVLQFCEKQGGIAGRKIGNRKIGTIIPMGKMEYGGPLVHGRLIFQYFPNNLPLFISHIRGSEQHTIDYQQHTRIIHKQNWRNVCTVKPRFTSSLFTYFCTYVQVKVRNYSGAPM